MRFKTVMFNALIRTDDNESIIVGYSVKDNICIDPGYNLTLHKCFCVSLLEDDVNNYEEKYPDWRKVLDNSKDCWMYVNPRPITPKVGIKTTNPWWIELWRWITRFKSPVLSIIGTVIRGGL